MPAKERHGTSVLGESLGNGGVSSNVTAESFTSGLFYFGVGVGHQILVDASSDEGVTWYQFAELTAASVGGTRRAYSLSSLPALLRIRIVGGTGNITFDAFEGVREIA